MVSLNSSGPGFCLCDHSRLQLTCLVGTHQLPWGSHKPTQPGRTLFPSITTGFVGCSHDRHQRPYSHSSLQSCQQWSQRTWTTQCECLHPPLGSGSWISQELGKKLFWRWELKISHIQFSQTFPTDTHNMFGPSRLIWAPPLPVDPNHHQFVNNWQSLYFSV